MDQNLRWVTRKGSADALEAEGQRSTRDSPAQAGRCSEPQVTARTILELVAEDGEEVGPDSRGQGRLHVQKAARGKGRVASLDDEQETTPRSGKTRQERP